MVGGANFRSIFCQKFFVVGVIVNNYERKTKILTRIHLCTFSFNLVQKISLYFLFSVTLVQLRIKFIHLARVFELTLVIFYSVVFQLCCFISIGFFSIRFCCVYPEFILFVWYTTSISITYVLCYIKNNKKKLVNINIYFVVCVVCNYVLHNCFVL